ncbi:MAG: hypothetical protein ABIF17_03135 [Patescibacteria group bacterium]
MNNYDIFISAIHNRKMVKVQINSKEKGFIERICVPFDFGPSRRNLEINPERYHFYDLNSPEGEHNLSIIPEQLLNIEMLEDNFEPAEYITWTPNWFISRDWGIYS